MDTVIRVVKVVLVLLTRNRFDKVQGGRDRHCRNRRSKCLEVQPLARLNSGGIRLVTFGNSGRGMKVAVCGASRGRSRKERVVLMVVVMVVEG